MHTLILQAEKYIFERNGTGNTFTGGVSFPHFTKMNMKLK